MISIFLKINPTKSTTTKSKAPINADVTGTFSENANNNNGTAATTSFENQTGNPDGLSKLFEENTYNELMKLNSIRYQDISLFIEDNDTTTAASNIGFGEENLAQNATNNKNIEMNSMSATNMPMKKQFGTGSLANAVNAHESSM